MAWTAAHTHLHTFTHAPNICILYFWCFVHCHHRRSSFHAVKPVTCICENCNRVDAIVSPKHNTHVCIYIHSHTAKSELETHNFSRHMKTFYTHYSNASSFCPSNTNVCFTYEYVYVRFYAAHTQSGAPFAYLQAHNHTPIILFSRCKPQPPEPRQEAPAGIRWMGCVAYRDGNMMLCALLESVNECGLGKAAVSGLKVSHIYMESGERVNERTRR